MVRKITTEEYRMISYVLLLLWIEDLLTDGEYNKIMDRVNDLILSEHPELAKKVGV